MRQTEMFCQHKKYMEMSNDYNRWFYYITFFQSCNIKIARLLVKGAPQLLFIRILIRKN